MGVVVKVQVNKNNKKELEIGQLGTDLVRKTNNKLTIQIAITSSKKSISFFQIIDQTMI